MATKRFIRLGDFLTEQEIKLALDIHRRDQGNFHQRVLKEIINPNMERINTKLGQENDADYLAYAVEFAVGMMRL